MIAIEAVTTTGATAALCQSVGLARATLYRGLSHPLLKFSDGSVDDDATIPDDSSSPS